MNSTMLDVKIDRQEPTELFEQVAAEIRRAIADGEAKPGERLPPARDLAAVTATPAAASSLLRSCRSRASLIRSSSSSGAGGFGGAIM